MGSLPQEAEALLAVAPEDFVAERQRLVRALRDEQRREDADAVAALRKPSPVVLAANRAARDRPKAARAAAQAAERVRKAQLGSDPAAYRTAFTELDESLDLLVEVALAHLGKGGKPPSESMSRRIHELLRNAVADERAREELAHGVLQEETEAAGFGAFAGVAPAPKARESATTKANEARRKRANERRREQERALRDELARAEEALDEARREERRAARAREGAERAVESLRARLGRLQAGTED